VRIGLVCPYSLTIPGGVQGQVMGLARALRDEGQEARVLAPCDGPPPASFVTSVGRSIPTAANGSVAPLAPDIPAQLRMMRALREERFDVLHVHEPLAPGPGVTALLVRGSPIVATFHAAGESASYRYLRYPLRRLVHRIDLRCAVSKDAIALAQPYLGGHYDLLFNGIEVDRFAKAQPWPTPGPTIFFVGRHEERKGLAVLLDALPWLPLDVRVWVGGTGPETEALRASYAGDSRVEWLGRIDDAEKQSRLRGATVFCAPSLRGESFGVVLLEAMAAQTPVVASDLPGYRNVARPDREALMPPPGDARALAAALNRVLTDSARAGELVAAGWERAEAYSMANLARLYLERYERLAGRRDSLW
jgi:phosphatidyl-myo-inositol alpha-mannosyltransferase